MQNRNIFLQRTTKETDISLEINLSGNGAIDIKTPIPFLNHMLTVMAFHGGFALKISAVGDIEVDPHHIVEDIGLVFGESLYRIIEEFGVVQRFGHAVIPMDDALSEVTIDACGRPYLIFNVKFPQIFSGTFDMALLREFFTGFANKAQAAVHCNCRYGVNSHHMAESIFKALGKAIVQAYTPGEDKEKVPSTKGII